MIQEPEVRERISRLDHLSWYDVNELTVQGILDSDLSYKGHLLQRNGDVFGASVIHFLKESYKIPFDERDEIDPILLAKALDTQKIFGYLKAHPELQTRIMSEGYEIPTVFIGNLRSLQVIVEDSPQQTELVEQSEYIPEILLVDAPLDTPMRWKKKGKPTSKDQILSKLRRRNPTWNGINPESNYQGKALQLILHLNEDELREVYESGLFGDQTTLKVSGETLIQLLYNKSKTYIPQDKAVVVNSKGKMDSRLTGPRISEEDLYYRQISVYPLLTQDEEIEAAKRIREGNQESLEKLVNANLRFVVKVAREYSNGVIPLMDLIGQGNLGLITAAKRFDETKGFKFISYAVWWIRQSILQYISQQGRDVRFPLNVVDALTKIRKIYQKSSQELHTEDILDFIPSVAEQLNVSQERAEELLALMQSKELSLERPFNEDSDRSLIDVLEDTSQESAEKRVIDESLKEEIGRLLSTLPQREAEALSLYFGINGPELTLEEIGVKFNLTRERVRQIKEKALRKLKHPTKARRLEPYLTE